MWNIIKPIFFSLSPEKAHYLAMDLLRFGTSIPGIQSLIKSYFNSEDSKLHVSCCGLHFKNRVGLAAGFDKDAKWLDALSNLGFGHIEVGTVTPIAQLGNPKPRLFRIPMDEALINRMGFNNAGVDHLVHQLKQFKNKADLIIGGNIGKNKNTDNEKAVDDYRICFNALFDYVDYFTVNISSPNTPGLRALQEKEPLEQLLTSVQHWNFDKPKPKPVFLKIAPDLETEAILDILSLVEKTQFNGIIATNTTISREGLSDPNMIDKIGAGGLSGRPVLEKSNRVLDILKQHKKPGLVLVGVGGIMTESNAKNKLDMGADLIQIYTGMIYRGPAFCKHINKYLLSKGL